MHPANQPPGSPFYSKSIYAGYIIIVENSTLIMGHKPEYEYTIFCDREYVDWAHEFATPEFALTAAKKFIDNLVPRLMIPKK